MNTPTAPNRNTNNNNIKTPGSSIKLTPCRRVGLSRNFNRSASKTPGAESGILLKTQQGTPTGCVEVLTPKISIPPSPIGSNLSTSESSKRKILTKNYFKPNMKKKKLEFPVEVEEKQSIDVECEKENVRLSQLESEESIPVSVEDVERLEAEIERMKTEIEANRRHEEKVDELKTLITKWRTGLNAVLEILSYRQDPPAETVTVLKSFNIPTDVLEPI